MNEFVQKICELLEAQNIDYMLSGSLALNTYTTPRMTRDIDIVIALSESNLDSFITLFSQDTAYFSIPAIKEAIRTQGMFNIIDLTTGHKLDFIVLKPTPFRQKEFQRRIRSDKLGFPIWVVSPEDLILSKLIWIQELMSDRQTEDLKQLLGTSQLDWDYLKKWIKTLNLKTYGLIEP